MRIADCLEKGTTPVSGCSGIHDLSKGKACEAHDFPKEMCRLQFERGDCHAETLIKYQPKGTWCLRFERDDFRVEKSLICFLWEAGGLSS